MVITIFATNQVCYNTRVYTLIREHFRETEQFMWFGVLVWYGNILFDKDN